jgi:hypothetical protein
LSASTRFSSISAVTPTKASNAWSATASFMGASTSSYTSITREFGYAMLNSSPLPRRLIVHKEIHIFFLEQFRPFDYPFLNDKEGS